MSDLIEPCPKCGSSLPFKGHRCGPQPTYGDLEQQLKAKTAEIEALRDQKECLRMLVLNWSGLIQSDIDKELNKVKRDGEQV